MNTSTRITLLAVATTAATLAQTTAPESIQEAIAHGQVSLDIRLRYEHVNQDNTLDNADALTLRTRLGYKTAPYLGFTAYAEASNTTALVDDYAYPGGSGSQSPTVTSLVADAETTEVSQVWLAYQHGKTTASLGRQNLVLNNARFVGNVAWRQNYQTFDAFSIKDTIIEKLTLSYAYIWHVKRVFADTAVQPNWDSDSHIFNASYSGLPFGTLTGYAYLLDFDNAAAQSTATYGVSFAGSAKLTGDISLLYRAEYSTQTDYGSSALDYRADYYVLEIGPKFGATSLTLGYEVLGSDNGQGFRTPLATLHAFNGWADMFLATPGTGLRDLYLKAATSYKDFGFTAAYHAFDADTGGADYGDEIDLQVTWKVHKNVTLLSKAAFYRAETFGVDTNKFMIQADYRF